MKAMILAAGFGTRLRPFSAHTPKPLFSIAGRPLLDLLIHKLHQAQATSVMVNCHHLGSAIEVFVRQTAFPIVVETVYESEILGSAGAIKNVAGFWDAGPFIVVNGDILFNFDLKPIYDFHLQHPHPVTLVVCHDPNFNTVTIDGGGFITAFRKTGPKAKQTGKISHESKALTFTGIHVIDPGVLNHIPVRGFADIIDVYEKLLKEGYKIMPYIDESGTWEDIGTPRRYRQAVYDRMARTALGASSLTEITQTALAGDGSDRRWFRLTRGEKRLVMADHGIKPQPGICEADAFTAIGRHLRQKGVAVPRIELADPFAGLVFLQDLGDTHLQAHVAGLNRETDVINIYQQVITAVVIMWQKGADGFDPSWAYQGAAYDQPLIMEKECRYFMEAFVNGVLRQTITFEHLAAEFSDLSEKTVQYGLYGFMHRDMQSRNIMLHNQRPYFIDFQGGRLGPLQYDLASLMIDPYVNLSPSVQSELVQYCHELVKIVDNQNKFYRGYQFCRITRNLQILGAFGFLSRKKNKPYFSAYIPAALATLKTNLMPMADEFPRLNQLVQGLP